MHWLLRIFAALLALTSIGIGWFRFVDGWTYTDALYMTVITLSTVGYQEVRPLTNADKLFVSGYLTVGLGIFLYGMVQIGESIVRAELGQWWRLRNMNQSIESLTDHFVISGCGRMGWLLCEDLADRAIPFVVVEKSSTVVDACREKGWHAVCADATDDETLEQAGLTRAIGLAATLASDADNLYVVISARLLSSDVQIVARARDDRSAHKLKRAGANRVVSPYESGAAKMGHLLTNPMLNDFVEIISDRNVAFDIVGVPITPTSPWASQTLAETDFRERGVMIVAVRRHSNGKVQLAPSGDTRITVGDELFALGDTKAVAELSKASV